jgi:hypothetical protein
VASGELDRKAGASVGHPDSLETNHPPLATPQLFFLVRWSTSPVRESSAACVESREVMPRPMMRLPPVDPEDLDEPDALRALVDRDEPEAPRALLSLLPLLPLLLEPLPLLPLAPRAPLLELPFPLLALIPPLLRFGMSILG